MNSRDELLTLPHVVGVADGVAADGTACIKVYVDSATAVTQQLPRQLDNRPVIVEYTGAISARD